MKNYRPTLACSTGGRPRLAQTARHLRVPAFSPVPLRVRADGWTPLRQAAFLGYLAETGSVLEAARRVGMARESAYRLRRKAGAASFVAAWDKLTGGVTPARRKVTPEERLRRALYGVLKPRMHRGCFAGIERKADNSALLAEAGHMARADALARRTSVRSQGFTPRPVSSREGAGMGPRGEGTGPAPAAHAPRTRAKGQRQASR